MVNAKRYRGHSIKWLNKHAQGFFQLKLKTVKRVSVNKQLNLIRVFGPKMTLFASTILLFCYSLLPSSSSSSTIVTVCLVLRLHGNLVQCSTEDLADWAFRAHYACLFKIRVCRWSPGEILTNVSLWVCTQVAAHRDRTYFVSAHMHELTHNPAALQYEWLLHFIDVFMVNDLFVIVDQVKDTIHL